MVETSNGHGRIKANLKEVGYPSSDPALEREEGSLSSHNHFCPSWSLFLDGAEKQGQDDENYQSDGNMNSIPHFPVKGNVKCQ